MRFPLSPSPLNFCRFSLRGLPWIAVSWAFHAGAQPATPGDDEVDATPPPALGASVEPPPREAVPPPPPPPAAPATAAPVPEPVPRTVDDKPADAAAAGGARTHDGFYLRLGVGANYGRSFVQTNRVSRPDVRIVGMGRAFDLWLGKTIPSGLTLGVSLGATDVSSDAAEIEDGDAAAASSWAFQLGGFLDTYPNPREGYHFGGAVSIAAVTAHADPISSDFVGGGLGVAVFAGYDAWIAPQLSVGGLLRLGGAVTRQSLEENGLDVEKQGTAYGAQLLATILYH